MLLFYGLLRSFMGMLKKHAQWLHARAKARYEKLEEAFSELEQEWKAHEVRHGRQVDFLSQLRLMKSYEDREAARKAWVRRERILNRRERWANRIVEFSGKKLPYSFGLIDMALVMNLLESAGLSVKLSGLTSYVMSLLA